jgi:imidazolonepropionase
MPARKIITHIKSLLNVDESPSPIGRPAIKGLNQIENAWLAIEDGLIVDFGSMSEWPGISDWSNLEVIDATGRYVLPAWCDSHTHIVYAGNRVSEFIDRIHGLSYAEIASRGGGILNSARQLRSTSEDELFESSYARLMKCVEYGTGAIEIKSGYGLSLDAELKMLRVIRRLKNSSPIPVVSTFLCAHALPEEFKGNIDGYVQEIISDYIPKVMSEGLADYIDVFCETGYFSAAHTDAILHAADQYALQAKIHVNQFTVIGGVQVGVKHKARSVDHLELLDASDIESLLNSDVMPVGLPSCSLFLGIPYTPARELLDATIPLALASDFNPGSSPSGNMNLVNSLACMKMKMTPDEVIMASTLFGAYAMGLHESVGSISVGKMAKLIITKPMHHYAEMMYNFGDSPVERVIV